MFDRMRERPEHPGKYVYVSMKQNSILFSQSHHSFVWRHLGFPGSFFILLLTVPWDPGIVFS